ncbi:hypothetical protein M011DRAFT_475716 [Sporormia fimetaria CBS 119925]|uniref:Rad21/Rec8-like protein N-terminal domain-containing protein n=1 Tax=Sporormia fimetaria CBS 119925 TaxID=1340428 RepID=A0A6A6VEE0_9PLEO|nr:hypothetical protein M011DRAFT_475716 [Sporormia fimetaria CBS 119925]
MFYSHEVLTSRKYGVATVWLVATLGASSKISKIKRKAIREVDVPKACRTIIDPGAPLALRLQGNLLYGVSRVYLEQCGYVLSDAENAHTAMRMMLKVLKNADLDPNAGKARPEQLILSDDPSFLPDLVLPPLELFADLDAAHLKPLCFDSSQTYTPYASQSDVNSPGNAVGGLIIPESSSLVPGDFQIGGEDEFGSGGDAGVMLGREEAVVPLEEGFTFDADGEFIELGGGEQAAATPLNTRALGMTGDAGTSARVREQHTEGQQAEFEPDDQMELDLPMPQNDPISSQNESSSQAAHPTVLEAESDPDSTSVAAPMQRKQHRRRVLRTDRTMELRTTDISDWNNNYLANMAEASRHKTAHRNPWQAKKNAEYYVWGSGVGGLGNRLPGAAAPSPFDIFSGDNLYKLYTGIDRTVTPGKKHDRDSGIDEATAEEARRVRPRLEDEGEPMDIGRGEEDEGILMLEDDEVELPRDAPAALDDQQLNSAMPWNISASIRGSSVVPRSAVPASTGRGAPGSRLMGSRMVSASPLQGRGRLGALSLTPLRGLGSELSREGSGLAEIPTSDDYEDLFALPPGEDEDVVRPLDRMVDALSVEGNNFLIFVADAVSDKRRRLQEEGDALEDADEILFEDILAPPERSRLVACQGLMMVLTLGTKGLLRVRQDEAFGEIGLRLTAKGSVLVEQTAGVFQDVGVRAAQEHGDAMEVEGPRQPEDQPASALPGNTGDEDRGNNGGGDSAEDDHDGDDDDVSDNDNEENDSLYGT